MPAKSQPEVIIDVWANSDARGKDVYLVTDRFKRLRMSAGLVEMLRCHDVKYTAYLGFDASNRRIAVGPVDIVTPTDAKPVNFDAKRHYTYAGGLFDKHALPTEPTRFVWDGKFQGWLMFREESFNATDRRGK